jgi:hypothetical protein
MRHHRKRGRRDRKKALRQASSTPVKGATAPEPPNLDAMVSALLEAEAHAAEAQAQALAETQAHVEALRVVPVALAAGEDSADSTAEPVRTPEQEAVRARHRSVIDRPHTSPAQTRRRVVYVTAGLVVTVLVVTVLSWMEWWDLSAVSLLPTRR